MAGESNGDSGQERIEKALAALAAQVGAIGHELGALRQEVGTLRQEFGTLRQEFDLLRDDLDRRFRENNDSLVRLIENVAESLHREMQDGFDSLNARQDANAIRLERHGGLLNAGARWTARMTRWSENIDRKLLDQSHEVGELRERIRKLEQGDQPQP